MRTYKVRPMVDTKHGFFWYHVVRVEPDGEEVTLTLRFGDKVTAEATARNLEDAQKRLAGTRQPKHGETT